MMYSAISPPTKAVAASAPRALPPALTPIYYLENFRTILHTVAHRYLDLLEPEERRFLREFQTLPEPAQALQVRLYSRQGPLIRSDRLRYAEIPDQPLWLQRLENNGWLRRNPEVDRDILLHRLSRAEILDWLLPERPDLKRLGRAELLARVTLSPGEILARLPFAYLEPLRRDVVQVLVDLFFGNRYQDLSTFVVSQLGHVRYPDYPLDPESRLFPNREAYRIFAALAERKERFHALREDQDCLDPDSRITALRQLADELPDLPLDDPQRVRVDRLRNRIARELERCHARQAAHAVYETAWYPPARERLARLDFDAGDWHAGYQRCLAMVRAPRDFSEAQYAARALPRCLRRLGIPDHSSAPAIPIDLVTLPAAPPEGPERGVLPLLAQQTRPGWHYVENWLFNALFGLCYWELLFLPVRGAFSHPFQSGPADLHDADFLPRRRACYLQLKRSLSQTADLGPRLRACWQRAHGRANPFVGWRQDGLALVCLAAQRIPRATLLAIFDRLLVDLRQHASGFPDLIHLPAEGGYRLLEVKGPGDQLRPNQRAWLEFFLELGMPAGVLRLEWPAPEVATTAVPNDPTVAGH